jgi:hypothetical protein
MNDDESRKSHWLIQEKLLITITLTPAVHLTSYRQIASTLVSIFLDAPTHKIELLTDFNIVFI